MSNDHNILPLSILTHDPDPQIRSVSEISLNDFDDFPLFTAEELTDANVLESRLSCRDNGLWTDYLNNPHGWHIISQNMLNCISVLKLKNCKYIKISEILETNDEITDYYLLNIFNRESIVSPVSKYIQHDGYIESFQRMVIDSRKASRLAGDMVVMSEYPTGIFETKKARQLIEVSGLLGLEFIDVEHD